MQVNPTPWGGVQNTVQHTQYRWGYTIGKSIKNIWADGDQQIGQPWDTSTIWAVAGKQTPIAQRCNISYSGGVLTITQAEPAPTNIRWFGNHTNHDSGALVNSVNNEYIDPDSSEYSNWTSGFNYSSAPSPDAVALLSGKLCGSDNNCVMMKISSIQTITITSNYNYSSSSQYGVIYPLSGIDPTSDIGKNGYDDNVSGVYLGVKRFIKSFTISGVFSNSNNAIYRSGSLNPIDEFYTPYGIGVGNTIGNWSPGYEICMRGAYDSNTGYYLTQSNIAAYNNDKFTLSGGWTPYFKNGYGLFGVSENIEINIDDMEPYSYTIVGNMCVQRGYNRGEFRAFRFYTYNDIVSTIASYGAYFRVDNNVETATILDTDTYCGHMDENGVTDGTWVKGAAIADTIQYGFNDYSDTPAEAINPEEEPAPGGDGVADLDGDTIGVNGALLLPETKGFTQFLAMSYSQISALKTALAATTSDFWNAISIAGDKDSASILNYIKSLRCYPFDFITTIPVGLLDTVTQINFGYRSAYITCGAESVACSAFEGDCGTLTIPPIFTDKTFLDYDNYTTCTIYLPYAGQLQIPASLTIGSVLHLKYIVDFEVGTITYYLYAEISGKQTPIANISGGIAAELPISGNDITAQADKLISATLQGASNTIGTITSIGERVFKGDDAGAYMSVARGAITAIGDEHNIEASKREIIRSTGGGGGFGKNLSFTRPFISVERPRLHIPAGYGHETGYACNYNANLGALSGFTVCKNPDLTGISGATAGELKEIYTALTRGVYL